MKNTVLISNPNTNIKNKNKNKNKGGRVIIF